MEITQQTKGDVIEAFLDTTSTILSNNTYNAVTAYNDVFIGNLKINSFIESVTVRKDKRLDDNTIICLDHEKTVVAIVKTGLGGYVMPITDNDSLLKSYASQFESVGLALEQ